MNWRWPESNSNNYLPWFVIMRRLAFSPLLLLGFCLAYVAILGGFGLSDAKRFWRNCR
jgi:hypothetical protein